LKIKFPSFTVYRGTKDGNLNTRCTNYGDNPPWDEFHYKNLGPYGIVRNPLYLSNGLLAMGMAILFRSLYAFLFSNGGEYLDYRKKVPWRMIPKLF